MTPVDVHGQGPVVVVRPLGEFDLSQAEHLRSALMLAIARSTDHVVVDCSFIELSDSMNLGVLVGAVKRLTSTGRRLSLVRIPASVERVLRLVALWDFLGAQGGDVPLDIQVEMALAWGDDDALRVTFG